MPVLFTVPGVISGKFLGLVFVATIFALSIYYIRRGGIFIRRVPALDAIEEAVGRATEMGKPVISDFGYGGTRGGGSFNAFTVAGLGITSYVAKLCAINEARILIPTGGSDMAMIMRPVALDIVKSAYAAEGKPELFNENDFPYMGNNQHSYIAGYVGMIQRFKPGAVISSGSHGYDGMSIAEQSSLAGAITISSGPSASYAAALSCASDYVIIGEEITAASAYLTEDIPQRASVRVQDLFKWISIILIFIGVIAATAGSNVMLDLFVT